nr:MAG TPA: hypothetical protein [Caudoviricetes sp.]
MAAGPASEANHDHDAKTTCPSCAQSDLRQGHNLNLRQLRLVAPYQ